MGHLINPIAFRLGVFKSWEYLFYMRNIYYSEYLHHILHIRNFLYFYLTRGSIINSGLLLSHIYFYLYKKVWIIKIFLYYIDLEKFSYRIFNNFYETYYKLLSLRALKLPKIFFMIHNADLFIYIFLFYHLFFIPERVKSKIVLPNFFKYVNIKFKKYIKSLVMLYNQIFFNKIKYMGNDAKRINKMTYKNALYKIAKAIDNKKKYLKRKIKLFYGKYFLLIKNKLKNICNIPIFKSIYRPAVKLGYDRLVSFFFNNFNISFILFFLYISRKMRFPKFKIYRNFIFKWLSILQLLLIFKNINYKQKYSYDYSSFIYFFLYTLYLSYSRKRIKQRFYMRDLLYLYSYYWLGTKYYFFLFQYFSIFFKNIFTFITPFNFFNFFYFFLSNYNVTAKFLSRYIGLKLQKGHFLFHIVNPILKELYNLYYIGSKYSKNILLYSFKKRYKKLYKNFISIFYSNILRVNNILYKEIKNFITFIFFDYLIYIKDILFKQNLFNIKKYLYIYFEYFNSIIIFYNFFSFFQINNIKDILFNKISKAYIISFFFFSNNRPWFNNILYFKFILFSFFISSINISKIYLNYFYYKNIWLKIISMQKRLLRKRKNTKDKLGLLGYKIAFKGRFSRKQKARYAWIINGKISINSLKSYIDYSFFTVPLRNSAISIKIWLCRNLEVENYKFMLKF